MPALVSSNWLAWGLGTFAFLASLLLVFLARGAAEMKRQWKENIRIAVVIGFIVHFALFAMTTIVTVYDDHHDVTGRWRVVVDEKNALKQTLKTRDDYIRTIGTQPQSAPRVVVKTVQEAHHCWLDSIPREPSPYRKGALSATMAVFRCNYRIDAPFDVAVQFDKDFLDGNVSLPASGFVTQTGNPVKRPGNIFFAQISSPNLAANQLVVVEIQTATKQFANAIGGEIKSK
ncbi:MAG: hypothetical protein ACRD3P_09775 [Terriglobales bacterium]